MLATLGVIVVVILGFTVYVGRNVGTTAGATPTPSPSVNGRKTYTSPPPMTINTAHVYLAKFHRVVADFVIQGGDPKGDGSGGPGYKFNDEPVKGEYTAGAVAMANSGPNTNGSQFFICTVDDSKKLTKSYNLFGYVASGMNVVLKIAQGDTMTSVTVQEQTS